MFRSLVLAAAAVLAAGNLYAADPAAPSTTKPDSPAAVSSGVVAAEPNAAATPGDAAKTPAHPEHGRRHALPGEAHRGRVTHATLENGVLTLSLDGKEYAVTIGEKTHAVVRTIEKDGKEEVVGLMITNGEHHHHGRTADGRKRTRSTAKS